MISRALALLFVGLVLALAWPFARMSMGAWKGGEGDVASAIRWNPADALGQRAMAYRHLEAARPVEAEAAARASLERAPMDGPAVAAWALAREMQDDGQSAALGMSHAADVAPRTTVARRWLLGRAVAAGDGSAFRLHLDALARVDPASVDEIAAPLGSLVGTPLGLELRALLSESPPWRSRLWQAWWGQAGRSFVFHSYLASLAVNARLSREEAMSWSAALERDSRFEELAWLWQQGHRESGPRTLEGITDAGFRAAPEGYGFGWRAWPVPGASVAFSPGSGPRPDDSALVLHFSGQRVPFEHVQQLLWLAPGEYRLDYKVRADGLRAAQGLAWNVHCVPGEVLVGQGAPAKGRQAWRSSSFVFRVPESGCRAQRLVLRLRAIGPSEQWAAGGVRYGALRLEATSLTSRPGAH